MEAIAELISLADITSCDFLELARRAMRNIVTLSSSALHVVGGSHQAVTMAVSELLPNEYTAHSTEAKVVGLHRPHL